MHLSRREMMLQTGAVSLGALASPWLGSWQPVGADEDDVPIQSPRVARFERMGFGMFLHWGLYSQIGRGEWAKHFQKLPTDEYMQLMKTFTAKDFSGRALARLAKSAGMRYITLTSRHHDGFSLYDTRGLSPYDVTHTPAERDLIEDFTTGCREEGIVPMLYCTTLDWTDPRFESDWEGYQKYLRASLELLCTEYGPIGGFWFDGNWSKPNADWQTDRLYGLIRKHQPEAMIINNTGIQKGGQVGHPEIDSVTFERGRPQPIDRRGHPKYVAGEMCHTMNFHWGLATRDFNYLSPAHVIEELCSCRRAGANLLMNMGPTAEGAAPPYERAALERVGDWIEIMGGSNSAITAGRPAGIDGEERDFGLAVGDDVHLFVYDLTRTADTQAHGASRGAGPRKFTGLARPVKRATWLDNGEELKLEQSGDALTLHATKYPYGTNTVVRVARLTTG